MAAISYHKDRFILATLDITPGHLRLENFYTGEVNRGPMHENPVSYLTVDYSGSYGASGSEQGTIIRVFDCSTLQVLHELRRGSSPAQISCLAFSPERNFILAASDHSTIHIWNLQTHPSSLSQIATSYLPKYFSYTRSVMKLSLPPEISWTSPYTVDQGPVAAFTSESEFYVAHLDGNLYKCRITENESEVKIEDTKQFLEFEGETVVDGERQWATFE